MVSYWCCYCVLHKLIFNQAQCDPLPKLSWVINSSFPSNICTGIFHQCQFLPPVPIEEDPLYLPIPIPCEIQGNAAPETAAYNRHHRRKWRYFKLNGWIIHRGVFVAAIRLIDNEADGPGPEYVAHWSDLQRAS